MENAYNEPMKLPEHEPQGTKRATPWIGMIGSKSIGIVFVNGMDRAPVSLVGSRDTRIRVRIKDNGRNKSGI